jgi:hypothetical protein
MVAINAPEVEFSLMDMIYNTYRLSACKYYKTYVLTSVNNKISHCRNVL